MFKFRVSISVLLVIVLGSSAAFGIEDEFMEQEYIGDLTLINPRHGAYLDFLESPDRLDYLTLAGEAYAAGDYENSARFYLARLQDVQDPITMYNLACNYSLMGEEDLAIRVLGYAVKAGFTELNYIEGDGDLDGLRDIPAFKEIVANLTENMGTQPGGEENRLYVKATSYFPGIVILPNGYDADKTYSVVIAFHGAALTPGQMLELYDKFAEPNFIFVALQAQYPALWDGVVGYFWTNRNTTNADIQLQAFEMTVQYIMDAVGIIKDTYKTDDIFLTGFSEGAAMSYMVGIMHPNDFAGIIPIAGYIEETVVTDELIAAGNALRVFAIHGTSDTSIPYEWAEATDKKLEEAGYDVELATHNGDHILDELSIKKAQEWMEQ